MGQGLRREGQRAGAAQQEGGRTRQVVEPTKSKAGRSDSLIFRGGSSVLFFFFISLSFFIHHLIVTAYLPLFHAMGRRIEMKSKQHFPSPMVASLG